MSHQDYFQLSACCGQNFVYTESSRCYIIWSVGTQRLPFPHSAFSSYFSLILKECRSLIDEGNKKQNQNPPLLEAFAPLLPSWQPREVTERTNSVIILWYWLWKELPRSTEFFQTKRKKNTISPLPTPPQLSYPQLPQKGVFLLASTLSLH